MESVRECWHPRFGRLKEAVSFFFGGGGSFLSSLLMQTTSLLFKTWAVSLSLGDYGSDRLGSGVLGALSEASTSDT